MENNDLSTSNVDLKDFLNLETTELTLGLYDNRKIAVKCWGEERAPVRVLALHGWLDNASTWDNLAPLLVSSSKQKIRFVAMDFTGHGLSSHDAPSSNYLMSDWVLQVVGVADALRWNTFNLIGHSMGGGVATLVAGSIPSRIERLILVDALGPYRWRPVKAPDALSAALKERPQLLRRQKKIYPNFQAALQRYVANNPKIKTSSAEAIVRRGTEEVLVGGEGEKAETGVCYRHDTRLVLTSVMFYSEKEIHLFMERITAPVLVLFAKNKARDELNKTENGRMIVDLHEERIKRFKDLQIVHIENTEHHLHLDDADKIYKRVFEFLNAPVTPKKQEEVGITTQNAKSKVLPKAKL